MARAGWLSRFLGRCLAVGVCIFLAGSVAAERSQEADLLYERGARAMRQGDFPQALDLLTRAADLAPEDPETLALLAQAQLGVGDVEAALALNDRLREIAPDFPELPLVSGMTYYRGGDWAGAREDLEAARRRNPDNARVHLLLGVVYHELAEYDEAEAALREAQRLDPGLQDEVEYRLGLLALARRDFGQARDLFERVGSRDPSSALARSAEGFLRSLEGRDERPWKVWGKVGVGYDTNVNLAGEDDELTRSGGENDVFFFGEAGGEFTFLDNDIATLRAGGSGYLSLHGEEEDFDIEAFRVWTQATGKLHERVRADLRYAFEYAWTDFDGFRRVHSVETALRFRPAERFLTRPFYRYEDRQFASEVFIDDLDRDGQVHTLGLDQYYFLQNPTGYGPGFVRVGYRRRVEQTEGADYDSRGNQIVGTLGLTLPWDSYLTAAADFEWREYASDNALDPFFFGLSARSKGAREDRILRTRLTVEKALTESLLVEATYRFVNRASNIAFFDYDRHIVTLAATYRY